MSCSYGCGQGGSLSFRLFCLNFRFPLKDFSPRTSVSFLRALLTPTPPSRRPSEQALLEQVQACPLECKPGSALK